MNENQPLRPMGNTYVDTKIASEHSVLACHARGAMDCTIVRPGDVYGPGSRPWVVLPLEMIKLGYCPQISLEEGMRLTEEWATEAGLV